jgi:hypothetical protein
MIPRRELRRLAFARLKDARALYAAGRYDAALYLCGYAVEIALKARICRTLRWEGFPQTRKQFRALRQLQDPQSPSAVAHEWDGGADSNAPPWRLGAGFRLGSRLAVRGGGHSAARRRETHPDLCPSDR